MWVVTLLLLCATVAATAAAVHFARRAAGVPAVAAASPAETAPTVEVGDVEGGAAAEDAAMLERFRAVTDHLELGVVVWDGTGDEVHRNPVADAMFAARDGQVLVAAAVEELRDDALAGRPVRREVELFGPPAASFVVVAIPFPSEVGGAMAVVEDRSPQRRTETVRRDFVANISHELKTPIGALGLLAETVRDEEDPDVVRRLADRMVTESERIARTIDDLLELSSIELGGDADFGDSDARSVLGEAVSRLGPAPAQAGVDVRVDAPAELVVHGDRRQLVSAVVNLLDNAVKYSHEDSEVVVAAAGSDDGTVRITVADSGVGVPRRDLDRIFERFYRVDRARSRRTGGTGLGLAIVKRLVEAHQGSISIQDNEPQGTQFVVRIPVSGE